MCTALAVLWHSCRVECEQMGVSAPLAAIIGRHMRGKLCGTQLVCAGRGCCATAMSVPAAASCCRVLQWCACSASCWALRASHAG
jgi:hypothetical protein